MRPVVLEHLPDAVTKVLPHRPPRLLHDPRTIAVLRNDLVEDVPNSGVLQIERSHTECQITPRRVACDSAAFRVQDEVQAEVKRQAGFVHARLPNAKLWYSSVQ